MPTTAPGTFVPAAVEIQIAGSAEPPVRWVAGADAGVEQKAHDLLAQIDAHREISSHLALDDA